MEIKSNELKNAGEVAPTSIAHVKSKITADQVRDVLCEYVGQSNYHLVKHIERGYVRSIPTSSIEEYLQLLMQNIRSQLISQLNPEDESYNHQSKSIGQVFDGVKSVLKLLPVASDRRFKDELNAFVVGTLLKFIA